MLWWMAGDFLSFFFFLIQWMRQCSRPLKRILIDMQLNSDSPLTLWEIHFSRRKVKMWDLNWMISSQREVPWKLWSLCPPPLLLLPLSDPLSPTLAALWFSAQPHISVQDGPGSETPPAAVKGPIPLMYFAPVSTCLSLLKFSGRVYSFSPLKTLPTSDLWRLPFAFTVTAITS